MKNNYKVIFITGISSGIGLVTATLLKDSGYHVYGGSSKDYEKTIDGKNGGFSKTFKCDVKDAENIDHVIKKIIDEEGRIDVLINCAGIGIASSVEDFSEEEMKSQIDVNVFGSIRTIQKVLPYMRKEKNGLIINITSIAGIFPMPFQSLYSASKSSMNIISDALRLELKPFNIKVVAVAPGDTRTNFTKARLMGVSSLNTAYETRIKRAIHWQNYDEEHGYEAVKVAKAIIKMINKKRPSHFYAVGFSYKLFCFLKKVFPNALVEFILTKKYLDKLTSEESKTNK